MDFDFLVVPPANGPVIRANMDFIYEMHRQLPSPAAQQFFAGHAEQILKNLSVGDIAVSLYEEKFGKTASIYGILDNARFQAVCRTLFRGSTYRRTNLDTLMTVHPPGQQLANTTAGIDLHTDGMYFNDLVYGLTVWIGLDHCGREAPGLEVLMADHREVRAYTGFDPSKPAPENPKWNWHRYRVGAFETGALKRDFPPERWVAPVLAPGDVLLFSNWCIHGTYRTPEMTKSRSAIQLRVEGNDIDPATAAP